MTVMEGDGGLRLLAKKLGRNWLPVLVVSMLAIVAVSELHTPYMPAVLWLCAVIAILAVREKPAFSEKAKNAAGQVDEPDVPAESVISGVRAGLAVLDTPVFILDKNASVLFQNGAAERAFGQLPAGAHISARLRSPGLLDVIRETITTGEPNQVEHSERFPSERVFIVRIARADMGEGAGPLFYILSFRDVSELRRIDRMRSDFVANASHELRTPLASLRGFIETMQGPARNDPKAQERFLAIMLDQATRMSRLVDDLMSLSRLELRANIAPDQKVDLVPVIGHVRDTLLPLANELDVDITLHLPDGPAEVQGDRDELVQVFQNLVENACKYGQEGKIVDVWLRAEPSKPVEVSVVDRGPGIPAEHVPRLTERFYRVSVADSRSKKGTGLGLAIVKHILTRHRARLIIKSELGSGTDFTVRF
ncbi:UNVERIFIED_ORG: two-component system phosphate regulon sensor histidine kinase PhoR [Rhizobium sp. SORGH_AS260]|uniref:phosphate regulon sensor histidine kinase PhoR n=1 Tax=Agrobacterium TaxID=357 RepID=UPI001FCBE160|nr:MULTISPECIES: phosphate regulon sensor histidine kinase PhoR [Agrobacterium]MCJ2874019.1 phosphate regulon sensor histidine kinase PhoR [Agrobacterium pusense]MDP9732161.1 two-component system phosphate regulon sensor histidine kinase PhoR [Rhizobium sp. SORGH_AS_0285]MDP9756004.1 two-component system phosphate regulon sensor histidine kinase PhoR [Rhizobium sp. SORGH_AS_0260]MDR6081334.1 two-component system phosphate regulon sensor histidine kinase PhoR [Agrobacterium sp. SORGH_AS_0440]